MASMGRYKDTYCSKHQTMHIGFYGCASCATEDAIARMNEEIELQREERLRRAEQKVRRKVAATVFIALISVLLFFLWVF